MIRAAPPRAGLIDPPGCGSTPAADLVEARALYAALGYEEVPASNAGPYADHRFAKGLE